MLDTNTVYLPPRGVDDYRVVCCYMQGNIVLLSVSPIQHITIGLKSLDVWGETP